MTTRSRKGKDVAWGFFCDGFGGVRELLASSDIVRSRAQHDRCRNPGPIFRITEPAKPRSRSHD
jgi:hypothetical protein